MKNKETMTKSFQTRTYPLLLLFLTVRPKEELAAIRSVQTEHKVPLRVVVGGLNACLVRNNFHEKFKIWVLVGYLVDHDWTACCLCFKEILLIPGTKNSLKSKSKEVADFFEQPEETHQLSTEDCVVALPRTDRCSFSSGLKLLRINSMWSRFSGFRFSKKVNETGPASYQGTRPPR